MHSRLIKLLSVFLIVGLLLSGCGGDSTLTPGETVDVPVVPADFAVIVKGRFVPNGSVQLSFLSTGEVVEVLVGEGDQVQEGDVLARLGNLESLEATIVNAEYELLTAQQALDALHDDLPAAQNQALQTLTDAKQEEYDAERKVNNLPEEGREFDRSQTEAKHDYAKAALDLAQEAYDNLLDGPDPDDIAAAESRIAAAEAQLTAARASLDAMELRAPMGGTVVKVNLVVGEQVAAGQQVFMLADFSTWFVETDDLTEIDVVDVREGQLITIIPDALPDLRMTGSVVSIQDVPVEKRGDITYIVKASVVEIDPRARWGMTVVMTFEE